MNTWLLYKDKEWNSYKTYLDSDSIRKDLNLDIIFKTAGRKLRYDTSPLPIGASDVDYNIFEVMKKVIFVPLETEEEITYRQDILNDFIRCPELLFNLYEVAQDASLEIMKYRDDMKQRSTRGRSNQGSGGILVSQLNFLKKLSEMLDRLDQVLTPMEGHMESKGMREFCRRFKKEYSPQVAVTLKQVMEDMEFMTSGGRMSLVAALGPGLKQTNIIIQNICKYDYQENRKTAKAAGGKFGALYRNLFVTNTKIMKEEPLIHDARHLESAVVATLLAYFEEFMRDKTEFFRQLYFQLAFYHGGVNLYQRLHSFGIGSCMPKVTDRKNMCFTGLVEMSMAIYTRKVPVSNSLNASDKWLVIVTGANQGGKSTYLRSMGLAQIFMQCGLFVTASSFESGIYRNVFTHFTRREDSTMNSGRLDEEMKRMDEIIRNLTEDSLLLLNESFATTTEKEGSIIAWDICRALYESSIRVLMVTHLLAFAQKSYHANLEHAVFLSAERTAAGERTFQMIETEPEMTSYGLDLYEELIEKKKTDS